MKNHRLILLVFLCSFFLCLRAYYYVNQEQSPQKEFTNQMIEIQPDSIKVDGDFLKFTGKMKKKKYLLYYVLKTPAEKALWTKRNVPDTAVISGETASFEGPRNLNGFDERKHYKSLGFNQKIQVESMKPYRQNKVSLSLVRQQLIWKVDQRYSKRLSSYVKALVLGYKDEQFTEYTAAYKTTGLLHLFTLSGLHIQFYLGGIHLLLKRLGLIRGTRLCVLTLVGLLLVFLTGGSYSTIRAVISFLLAFGCLTFERSLSKLDQWSLMLYILVFCFPLVFWSVGAQLSIYFALMLLFLNDLSFKNWQQMFMFSALALPLLIYSFSEWTVVGGLLTLLLFPLFEWLILPGSVVLFFGCFIPVLSMPAPLFDGLFSLLEKGLALVAFPNIVIGHPSFPTLLCLILCVLLLIDRLAYQQPIYWIVCVSLFLLATTAFSANGLVAFVDVGQGDSIFIKLPFKQETFLIDTGGRLHFKRKKWQTRQLKNPSDYNLVPFLKSVGCRSIDHVVITHNDADHMGELGHLLNEITVKNLYLAKGSQMELKKILQPINDTAIHLIKRGDTVGDHLKLQILSPETSQGKNDDSVVAYFVVNKQRFLLTGDLETTGEEKMGAYYPKLTTDFLKIGHHGSNTSTGEALLKQLQPKYGIISVGRRNRYGHPTVETLDKLKKYQIMTYRTDHQGMVYYQWSALSKKGKIKVLIDFPE